MIRSTPHMAGREASHDARASILLYGELNLQAVQRLRTMIDHALNDPIVHRIDIDAILVTLARAMKPTGLARLLLEPLDSRPPELPVTGAAPV